jgi:hypothetical protein
VISLGTLLTIVGGVIGVAVVWGSLKNEVGNLKTKVRDLEVSRDKHGERFQALRDEIAELRTDVKLVRQATRAHGVPIHAAGQEGDV